MSPRRVIIIGGGEHARVVAEAVQCSAPGFVLLGFVDPHPGADAASAMQVEHLGDDSALASYPDAAGVLGFGSLTSWQSRAATVARLRPLISSWATVVHRTAWLSPSASLGEGTVVMAGVIVQTNARVGAHCIINSGAIVEHDVTIGDHVHVAPGATIGGGSRVGEGAYIGLGASVRDHVVIGAGSIVAMGASVVADVAPNTSVKGVPAR